MNIQMVGIDHSVAPVSLREKFSFTTTRVIEAVQAIRALDGVTGCVMISTCNRMEVYLSTKEDRPVPVYETLCRLKQLPEADYRDYFVHRSGMDAVRHLFSLAAGMQSRIVGEDQILTQVKQALTLAREAECTDKVMEVLFRMAVTAGKKVKREVTFEKATSSAISSAIDQMSRAGYVFDGIRCLVIGNGEMGKRTATALREQGADVTVTVRQYRSGVVQIPSGCHRINYGERYDYLPQCDLIVSATASPNLTIRRETLEQLPLTKPQVFLDLAVPRDIEPDIRTLPNVSLYDIDSFASGQPAENTRQIEEAEEILNAGAAEFETWYECRDFVPKIQSVGRAAAEDIVWRMGKAFDEHPLAAETREAIAQSAARASEKVVEKLLFALRDTAEPAVLRACLDAFASAYPEEDA